MSETVRALAESFPIRDGDTVIISSDIRRVLFDSKRKGNPFEPDDFIDTLIQKIGCEGTLLFPTYNWDYCQGIPFDYIHTKCKTGTLGTIALKRDDFKRTKHPIYSFAVWGKDKEWLCNMNNISSFGADSPFAYLKEKNALNILIDVDYQNCFTYVHFVEEQSKIVKYRYQKMFSAPYIDVNGQIRDSKYSMFVRYLELDVENKINRIGHILEENKIANKLTVGIIPIISLRMGDAYPIIENDIMNNRSRNICTYIGQED